MKRSPYRRSLRETAAAFTLVEVLVSTALVAVLMGLLLSVVDQTSKLWSRSRSKASQFQAARNAFEAMSRRMSQATLNTYWRAEDYNTQINATDLLYRRISELQFMSGATADIFGGAKKVTGLNTPTPESYPFQAVFFHAPLGFTSEPITNSSTIRKYRGMDSMLTACGYFVEFGDDPDVPQFLRTGGAYPPKYRYRLMELTEPAELFNIYERPDGAAYPKNDVKTTDPRIYDENYNPYQGLVTVSRSPIGGGFIRPAWMAEALNRESVPGASGSSVFRFKHTHVLAENVLGMIIIPKLAERDRVRPGKPPVPDPSYLELAPHMEFDSWRVVTGGNSKDSYGNTVEGRVRDNLLPPIVQVTMIAIDEVTAQQMDLRPDHLPPWMTKYFKPSSTFDTVQSVDDELQRLLTEINSPDDEYPNVNYRVFTTDVVMRGSKWSRDPGQE